MRLNHGSWYEKKIVCTGITGTYMFIVFTSITLVNCDSQISLFPHYKKKLKKVIYFGSFVRSESEVKVKSRSESTQPSLD